MNLSKQLLQAQEALMKAKEVQIDEKPAESNKAGSLLLDGNGNTISPQVLSLYQVCDTIQ